MSVTRAEVDRIAELARLRLDEGEADRLTGEMNRILEHADRLRAADTPAEAEAPPERTRNDVSADGDAATIEDDVRGTRADGAPGPDPLQHAPGEFAPRFEDGFFVVPPPRGVQADS